MSCITNLPSRELLNSINNRKTVITDEIQDVFDAEGSLIARINRDQMEEDRIIDNICENKVYKSYCKDYKIANPRDEDSIKGFFLWLSFMSDTKKKYNKEAMKIFRKNRKL